MNILDLITPIAVRLYRAPFFRTLIRESAVGHFGTKLYYQLMMRMQRLPRFYTLEFTNHCNMHCVMCKNALIEKEKRCFLDPAIAEKLVKELDEVGNCWLMLVKQGDALLHPQFDEILSILRSGRHQHTIILTTNGLALNKQRRQAILDTNVDYVNVSIDSLDPDTYKKIRGVPLAPVLKNLNGLLREAKEQGKDVKVSVNMVVVSSNRDEIEHAKKYWEDRGVFLTLQKANNWIEGSEEAGNEEWTNSNSGVSRYPCQNPFLNPAINADGTVSLCCGDWNNSTLLGDFATSTMAEIWDGEAYKHARRCHLKNDFKQLPLCQDCTQWQTQPNIFFASQYEKETK